MVLLPTTAANAQDTEGRLLMAPAALQMPGSEANSNWWFVSYLGEDEPPSVERLSALTGCSDYPEGGVRHANFDVTLDQPGEVQPRLTGSRRRASAV